MQSQDKGHKSESYSFGVVLLLNLNLSRMMVPDRRALGPHSVLLFYQGRIVKVWLVLTGGLYSEAVFNAGLIVHVYQTNKISLQK